MRPDCERGGVLTCGTCAWAVQPDTPIMLPPHTVRCTRPGVWLCYKGAHRGACPAWVESRNETPVKP